jgi:hypothetical protein
MAMCDGEVRHCDKDVGRLADLRFARLGQGCVFNCSDWRQPEVRTEINTHLSKD